MTSSPPKLLRDLLMTAAVAAAQLLAPAAFAQEPTLAQQACSAPATPALPRSTLPMELLDYLERTATSPFVEAFLLAHMTEGGNLDHWLGRCAKAFLDTPPDSLGKLRERRVSADQILEVLRTAEEARLADVRLRGSSTAVTIFEVLERLRTDTDASALAVNRPYLSAAEMVVCGSEGAFCDAVRNTSAKIDALVAAYEGQRASAVALERAVKGHTSARDDSLRLATELAEIQSRKRTVDSLAAELQRRPSTDTPPAWADSLKALLGEQAQLDTTVRTRQAGLNQQVATISRAVGEKEALERTATEAQGTLDAARRALQLALTTARDQVRDGNKFAARVIAVVDRAEVRLNSLISSPAALVASGEIRSAQSPDILLELTDFIIARAKQELVIGYLVQLYDVGREERVAAAFPETFRLMDGLSQGNRLSAVAAGRIPLNVWRAAMSEDYRKIPITLARNLCGAGSGCERQLASAEPALLAAERLVSGDPVFEVLRDVPAALREQGAGWDTPLRDGVANGLSIVATLADALRVQGIAPTADPLRHPYILSARALSQLSARQRDAFVRVLLIDALPATVHGVTLDPSALLAAAERATRAAEGLAGAGAGSGSTDLVIRSASTVFESGIELAQALLPASQQPALKGIETRWEAVFDVLEPLARADYSLVMPRTMSLVRTLGGDRARTPAPVLTWMGLATSLSSAQTSADVRSAFETAAAPAGLWQEKRYQQGSRVSVSAFPGFAGGVEWLDTEGEWGNSGGTVGLSMPVGLEIQLRFPKDGATEQRDSRCTLYFFCSAGLYFGLIDLGALATYRVSETDSANVAPKTGFGQVFAPGAHLSLGLRRTPLALLIGGQLMPRIRDTTGADGATREANAIRASAAIVADVTLFRFE